MFSFGETVTRLRAPLASDPYSGEDTLEDWSNPSELPIPGCALVPVSSAEAPGVDRVELLTLRTLAAPFGADILPTDRIRDAAGTVWKVDGRRADFRSPFTGHEFGTTVALRLIEG